MMQPFGAAKAAGLALLLSLAAAIARAQPPVTVELHHRSAEAVVTALRPSIAPATLAGAGTLLQVRAQPTDLARVQRLIEQADQPLRSLAVELRDEPPSVAPDGAAEGQSAVAAHAAKAGAVTLSTGRALAPDSHGNGQMLSTQPGSGPVQIVEGDPLLLSMPATQSLWIHAHATSGQEGATGGKGPGAPSTGAAGAAGVVQFDAVADFTARIWLAGETVAIDLQPRPSGRWSAGSDAGADHATFYGRVGQWTALADSGARSADATGSGAPRAGLWIKVEPAR
jgi:hypothetical protein